MVTVVDKEAEDKMAGKIFYRSNDQAPLAKRGGDIWDKLAPGYDRQVAAHLNSAYQRSIEKVQTVLHRGDRVLEIACGTGIVSLGVAAQVDRVMAVDQSPRMIAAAKEKAERLSITNITFQVADGHHLPYADGSYDVILLFNALHVMKEPDILLTEINRLLARGGYLLMAVDCFAEPVPLPVRLQLLTAGVMKKLGVIKYLWFYRREEVRNLLKLHGFSLLEEEILFSAPVNYYLKAEKI